MAKEKARGWRALVGSGKLRSLRGSVSPNAPSPRRGSSAKPPMKCMRENGRARGALARKLNRGRLRGHGCPFPDIRGHGQFLSELPIGIKSNSVPDWPSVACVQMSGMWPRLFSTHLSRCNQSAVHAGMIAAVEGQCFPPSASRHVGQCDDPDDVRIDSWRVRIRGTPRLSVVITTCEERVRRWDFVSGRKPQRMAGMLAKVRLADRGDASRSIRSERAAGASPVARIVHARSLPCARAYWGCIGEVCRGG